MDIRLFRKRLQTLYANLNNTDYLQASIDMKAFLALLRDEQLIQEIITSLPSNAIDIDHWADEVYTAGAIKMPEGEPERVALCLAILEKYKDDIEQVAYRFHIASSGRADHIRYYVDCVARPVYQYIDRKLNEQEIEATSVSQTIINAANMIYIGGDNYGSVTQNNSDAMHLLGNLTEEVKKTVDLDTDAKRAVIANIDTVKAQITSTRPSTQIIKTAWDAIKAASHTAGAITLVQQISELLQAHTK